MPEQQRLLDLIADGRKGILAAVTRVGYPHMTNVLYAWDAAERVARVSADRVKGRILQRDHHAALHVPGAHFWPYAVAECDAETSPVATQPGDEACRELLEPHSAMLGSPEDEAAFFNQIVQARRLVIRLRVRRLYGVVLERPPGT